MELTELSVEAMRSFFLIIVPLGLGVALAGIIVSALQGATAIRDEAMIFAAKLGTALVLSYMFFAQAGESLIALARHAWG